MKSKTQGNGDNSQYNKIWQKDSANQDKVDVSGESAGGGDEKKPQKPKKDDKPEDKRNETKINIDSHTILPNGRRWRKFSAVVRPENLGQGSNTNNYVAKNWKKNLNVTDDYHAGHIIGCMLGGSGSDVNNLVLMHSGFNNGSLKSFEFRARNLLRHCQEMNPNASVEARITVSIGFAPGGDIPYHLFYGVKLVVNGVVEKTGYAAIFIINCCANGAHDGPCNGIQEDYYYTDE
ncbi:uncharacterized protein LOC130689499 [Daphnia carinata]|uniref:uncharacterized protein LOC130689499 n=1 Tax=Daphnia carinata TaxID=120202 RepID=UPI0028693B91|nr:uncharacterized protein LOC130689499 [Daphnia carinata]